MDMNRRQFFRVSGAGLVGSSLVAMGFSPNPQIGAVFRPTDRLAIGIAVVTPHSAGQGDWPETVTYQRNGADRQEPAPSRYLQVDHGLAVVAYPTVSLSYAVTPSFSLGAGFVWGVATVDLSTYTEALSPSNADDFFGHQDVKAHFTAKDFFVPGFVAGMARGLSWPAVGRMASLTAAYAIEHPGTQEHAYSLDAFLARYRSNFGPDEEVEALGKGAPFSSPMSAGVSTAPIGPG